MTLWLYDLKAQKRLKNWTICSGEIVQDSETSHNLGNRLKKNTESSIISIWSKQTKSVVSTSEDVNNVNSIRILKQSVNNKWEKLARKLFNHTA